MKFFHAIYAALGMVLMGVPAQAATPVWSAQALSCEADTNSIVNRRISVSGFAISHSTNNVDLIQLYCHVEGPLPAGTQWNLVVTYRDSSGTATSALVSARLYRQSRTTGAFALLANFNSNGSPALAISKGSIAFSHTFDFSANYYVLHWVLDRTLTSQTVQAFGVAIERVTP